MYSREHRPVKRSADSDSPTTSQFAPRPFVIQQKTEEVKPQQEQTPDSQAKTAEGKESHSNFPDKAVFTRHLTPPKIPRIQMKLTIGKPGDKYEQEADRVAGEVVSKINAPQAQPVQSAKSGMETQSTPVVHNTRHIAEAPIQRLPVKINDKLIDVKKDHLSNNQNIEDLFNRLGLTIPEKVQQDNTLNDTQKRLNKLAAAVGINSINRDVFLQVISALIDGKQPNWTTWDELEQYQNKVQPIIDERDDIIENQDKDKSTYFQWYCQNLKTKGMDYEALVNNFVKNNAYGMGLAEAHAIFGYTTVLFYKKLNELTRKGIKEDKTQLLTALLQSALAKLPISPETQYRGMNIKPGQDLNSFLALYQENQVVTDNQFNSAANYPLQPFWGDANIRFTIQASQARNITELAFGTHFIEILSNGKKKNDTHESLFLPNSQFLVKKVTSVSEKRTKKDNKTNVETTNDVTVYNIILEQIK